VITTFLKAAGLTQALRGFEADMIIMSTEWERKKVTVALNELKEGLDLLENTELNMNVDESMSPEIRSLEDRKLDTIELANGSKPRTPTSHETYLGF